MGVLCFDGGFDAIRTKRRNGRMDWSEKDKVCCIVRGRLDAGNDVVVDEVIGRGSKTMGFRRRVRRGVDSQKKKGRDETEIRFVASPTKKK